MLTILTTCAAVTVVLGQSPAQKTDMFGMINLLYYKADKNLDGVITEAELWDVYQGFDQNGDQSVSHQEFVPLWAELTGQDTEMASAYFFLADINDNQVITDDDVRPTYVRFDLNGDGQVAAQEFNVKWQEIYRESPLAVLYLRTDTNHDDDLQADEYPKLFASLGAGKDGSVTESSFELEWVTSDFGRSQDSDALFLAVDTNKDKVISETEVGAFLKKYDLSGNGNIEIIEVVQVAKLFPPLS